MFIFLFISLSFFWFLRTVRIILFYIYLWQLKEYHIGRFLDHFRTYKGRQLFLNPLKILKIILVSGFFIFPAFFPLILGFFYLGESLIFYKDFLRRALRRPVLTKKTGLILVLAIIFTILAPILFYYFFKNDLVQFSFWLLIIDIFTPILISGLVLIFQPLAVLGRLRIIKKAKQKRASFKNLLVIGITGSYGKTSTKEFLYTILSEKFGKNKVLKTKEHQNSEVGVSKCILNDLKPEHEIFIVEMGAYGRGGIKLLCDIVKPKIGILTGINEQHMATFGSQENIIKTKFELIESLSADGVAFFNTKNKYCRELYEKTKIKKILYGGNAQFSGEENILGAKAVAKELGMTDEETNKATDKIENKFPGIKIKKGVNELSIIEATYSANPNGVMAHLEYLKTLPGRKVIIMPCLIELGSASEEAHRRIGQKIGEVCDLAIIMTKDRFKEIKEAAGEKAIFLENPKEIFEKIKNFCQPEDVVLLEGRLPKQLIELLK